MLLDFSKNSNLTVSVIFNSWTIHLCILDFKYQYSFVKWRYSLIAASQEGLVALLNVLEQHGAEYGLGINYNKTKVIIVDREHDNHREIKSIGRCEVM
ncbi:unnamed protein product [Callosobruchus maculatus]|uniref:Uncharacterized protein n=1 Tax=Callosobruchus maculatus TaxID=64391 RepID=A0A653CTN3_CALMS|nr:unnamed protein product [Callosobruchus maculatus]